MVQSRIWDFGAPRKSQYLNDHFIGIVPTKYITLLHASPTDVMKFIISAGVTNISPTSNEENTENEKELENE